MTGTRNATGDPALQSHGKRRIALLVASAGSLGGDALGSAAEALQAALHREWHVATAVRDGGAGFIDAVRAILGDEVRELVVVPMHPQYSAVTTGVILRDLYGVLQHDGRRLNIAVRTCWHDDAGYVNAIAKHLARMLDERDLHWTDGLLQFTADDLSVHRAGDTFLQHLRGTAALVAARLGWPEDRWSLHLEPLSRPQQRAAPSDRDGRERRQPGRFLRCRLPFPLPEDNDTKEGVLTSEAFVAALRGLVLHGPHEAPAGDRALTPLVSVAHPMPIEPASLFMIGAALAGGVGGGRGPEIRYSDPHAFSGAKKSRRELRAFLDWTRTHTSLRNTFVWNTCQRIELYGWLPALDDGIDLNNLADLVSAELFGNSPIGLQVNVLGGVDAWHHLARTACGLNSQLPGDRDVADQLQTACRIAQCAGTAGPRAVQLVDQVLALARDVHAQTSWGGFSTGYCAAAIDRIREVDNAEFDELRHVVVGGSTTSRSVLAALTEAYGVPQEQLTLIYRDHHGQLKQLRAALGHGKRLRVHTYSETQVLATIAEADYAYFGIDQPDPVLDATALTGLRDYAARFLTLVDFNSFGSIRGNLEHAKIRVWTSKQLDEAVSVHAAVTMTRAGFEDAVDEAEAALLHRLPMVTPQVEDASRSDEIHVAH